MSFKFFKQRESKKRYSQKRKAELMEQAVFLEELAHDLQSLRFMAY